MSKAEVAGARIRLNGGVLAEFARPGLSLPPETAAEEYDGRERWEVVVYGRRGVVHQVPCGTVREGVSREAAHAVFEAVRRSAGEKT
jgi:hypothetical protein